MVVDITNITNNSLERKGSIWYGPKGSYWSNLEKSKNEKYTADLNNLGVEGIVAKYFPQHKEAIFSAKRLGGLATLDFSKDDIILDAGCMWGALSIPIARTGATVIAIDQTEESLLLLAKRKEEEKLNNLHLICADLSKIDLKEHVFDKAIINGVLEWIPEESAVEVKSFTARENTISHNFKKVSFNQMKGEKPIAKQMRFLEKMKKVLKEKGMLYLAIENRYNFSYFYGLPEPHCGIKFISLLPRQLQNVLSLILRGRRFNTWTYSRRELVKLLQASGFSRQKFYYAFPDYRLPELVLTGEGMGLYNDYYPIIRKSFLGKVISILNRKVQKLTYKYLKLKFLAPSFIVHAFNG